MKTSRESNKNNKISSQQCSCNKNNEELKILKLKDFITLFHLISLSPHFIDHVSFLFPSLHSPSHSFHLPQSISFMFTLFGCIHITCYIINLIVSFTFQPIPSLEINNLNHSLCERFTDKWVNDKFWWNIFQQSKTTCYQTTRLATASSLQLRKCNFKTLKYGWFSTINKCLSNWNQLQKHLKTDFKEIKCSELKTIVTNHILSQL